MRNEEKILLSILGKSALVVLIGLIIRVHPEHIVQSIAAWFFFFIAYFFWDWGKQFTATRTLFVRCMVGVVGLNLAYLFYFHFVTLGLSI